MTGSSRVDRPPRDDAELARDIVNRLDDVEHPVASRVGPWVITARPGTGQLLASHVGGGSVVLANVPEAGADPDAVVELPTEPPAPPVIPTHADWDLSTCGVRRTANQSINNATWTMVDYNTTDWDLRRDAAAQADGDGITIRDAGVYSVEAEVRFAGHATGVRIVSVDVTGATGYGYRPMLALPNAADPLTQCVAFTKVFAAGDTVRVFAWQNSGGALNLEPQQTRLRANMVRHAD